MVFDYTYTELLERCKMLSSYEGRNSHTADGESNYIDIKIGTQDEPLLKTFLQQGAHIVESGIGKVVDSTYTTDGFEYDLDVDTERWVKDDTLKKNIFETVVMFAMKLWMSYNNNSRSESYESVYQNMLSACVKNAYRKKKPNV